MNEYKNDFKKPESPNRLSRYTKSNKDKDPYDFDFLDDLEK